MTFLKALLGIAMGRTKRSCKSPKASETMTTIIGKSLLAVAALAVIAAACASDPIPTATADSVEGVVVQPVAEQADEADADAPAQSEPVDEAVTEAADETAFEPVPVVDFVWFDGTPGSTSDLIGTPTIVNFWASNCPPCLAEMPAFEEAHQALIGSVDFVGIDVADDPEAARDLAEQTGVTYRLAEDPDSAVFQSFGGFVLPTTVFLNERGEVAYVWIGALTGEELRKLVDTHLLPGSL